MNVRVKEVKKRERERESEEKTVAKAHKSWLDDHFLDIKYHTLSAGMFNSIT